MAIDSADRNHRDAWRARRWQTPVLGAGAVLGLSVVLGLSGCSKGGAPDLNGCVKLSDPLPGDDTAPPSRTLYVELRTPTGARLPIVLDTGSGGNYSGTRALTQCDEQGTYTVEKVVLVAVNGDPVATATRVGSNYTVTYKNGQVSTVPGSTLGNISTSYSAPGTAAATLQSVAVSAPMVRQGDPVSVQVAVTGDPCGIRESMWWLAPGSVGMMTTPAQAIPGGSGSVTLRVPPTADQSVYFVEGQITLKSGGRVYAVRRKVVGETTYSLIDQSTGVPVATPVPVAMVTVAPNPDADKVAPQAVSMDASPAMPVRCGTANLTLHLSDDKGLAAGQKVKVWLGTLDSPKLTSTMVTGSEYLYGSVQIPLDAPAGVWYAWPDLVVDGAGNSAQATFVGGKFMLTGTGITPQPIAAGTFVVPSFVTPPDAAVPSVDFGVAPDMAMQLPAVLTGIAVSPSSITMAGMELNVAVSWTDNAQILK